MLKCCQVHVYYASNGEKHTKHTKVVNRFLLLANNINLQAVEDILTLLRSDDGRDAVNSATDMISELFQLSRKQSFPMKKRQFNSTSAHVKTNLGSAHNVKMRVENTI